MEMKIGLKSLAARFGLGTVLAAGALVVAVPAQAHDRGRGDDAAIAIGAGIIGLAIGAAIADSDDDRYYDDRYYHSRRYVTVRGHPGYYYYYDGYPNRYYRDRYYDRYYGRYWRERRDWDRDRWRDRRDHWRDRRDYRRDHRRWHDRRDYRRDHRRWHKRNDWRD